MRKRPIYFLPIGIAIDTGRGVAIKNLAIGIGIGAAIGIAMSGIVQSRNREN